jgi:hypothetical protein
MVRLLTIAVLMLCASLSSCGGSDASAQRAAVDHAAESYVRLSLVLGQYDPDYVDAYTGPEEWNPDPLPEGEDHVIPAREIAAKADSLVADLDAVDLRLLSDLEKRRVKFLRAHILSLKARAELVGGKKMTFDEESKALYDAVAEPADIAALDSALAALESLVPGEGELAARVERYREDFTIPKDLIDPVFTRAIEEARSRTLPHIPLPEGERFDTEYVTGVSWGAYNWYKGGYRSLIQVNVELPVRISSPLGLAVHEGYPGHHVQNVLVEKNMLDDRGWMEYTVQPLYCPQATLNEGGANLGIRIAFTEEERVAFIRDVLFPMAGLDPAGAEQYLKFEKLTRNLKGARTEAVRRYLDGDWTREEANAFLQKYSLMSQERADMYLRFGEKYRSYVVTYVVGLQLVEDYIEREAGDDTARRWELMREIYAVPHLPSDLQ